MNTELDYREIETVLEHILGKQVNFGALVEEIMETGQMLSPGTWLDTIGNFFLEQLKGHGKNIAYLLLLIISAAMLSTIAKAFRNRQISDMGFYMIYLLMILIMMRSFGVCYSLTENVIADLVDFMKVLMPTYLMAAAVSAYRTSAVLYYEGFLILIYYLQKLVAVFVLPAIRCYVLFSMLGHLGKEELFSRGQDGLKRVILFVLKAMIGVAGGLQMIQGMISPAIDEFKQTALSRGVSSLGNIGNIAQNVTDVVLGSGVLLKNGIGVVAAIVIVSICLLPVLEVGGYVVFYHVLAAVAEPISDRKLVNAIGDMGEGIGLLAKLLFTVGAMFLLTIAIICVTTGGVQ